MFSLICAWIDCWVNDSEAGDFRRHRAHYDTTVMYGVSTVKPADKAGRVITGPHCILACSVIHLAPEQDDGDIANQI